MHAAPFFPHSVSLVPATHAPAAQHPAHVPGPQMQEPPLHASPAAHAGPEPHWHRPLAEQLSARRVSHTAQAPPPVPHSSIEGAAHVLPAQQPPGQYVPSHTQLPPTQCCPAPHTGYVPH